MNENFKIKGRIKLDTYRGNQLIKAGEWIDNVITDSGKAALATLLNSANVGNSLIKKIGFGRGVTPATPADTHLENELSSMSGYSRTNPTISNPSPNIIQYVGALQVFNPSSFDIEEVGLFSASSGGTMFARQLTGGVHVDIPNDTLQITWQIIIL